MVVVSQSYDTKKLVGKFEESWGEKFIPTSRESQCKFFEELVFGWNINPIHAQEIVKDAIMQFTKPVLRRTLK